MDFKNGYEEIESIKPRTSYSTYLTLIDWLKSIDPKEEDNQFRRNEFIDFLKDGSEDDFLEKRIEQLSDLADNEPDYFEENYLDGKSLRDWTLSKTIDLHSTSIDFHLISIFFKNFFNKPIEKNIELEDDDDLPNLPLRGLFLLKALYDIESIKEEEPEQIEALDINYELFGYENKELLIKELKRIKKLEIKESVENLDYEFFVVNDALAHDFYWGRCSSNKIFISQRLFHQEKINYPNPEELDEERMKEHDLNPDEFNEPMYELILYLWIYCDSQEKVEIGDIFDYYGIQERFIHPLSIFWF